MSKILSEAGLIEAFGRMRTTHPQNSPSQQRIHLSHEALRAERDALAESRDWWRTARSDEISKDLEALVQAVTQRGSDPMSDNPDRAAIERAAIGPLQRIIDEQDQDLAAMGERVRVLTEALAAVRDAYYDTTYADLAVAMERARSVLAAVPSEPSMKCPTCGSEDRAERLCVKCESIRLGFMAHFEHDRLTCPDSFHSVPSEPPVCATCGSDNPRLMVTGTIQNPYRERCADAFHSVPSEEELPTCSRCHRSDWHDIALCGTSGPVATMRR
jgi:hypothetical protein